MTYLDLGPWSLHQCQTWVLSHGVGLKSNEKVVVQSHSICATMTPVNIAGGLQDLYLGDTDDHISPLVGLSILSNTVSTKQ